MRCRALNHVRAARLRLDGDWFVSTPVWLERLHSQVAPDGVSQVDDYDH
jgi:hypothetical protein